MLIVIEGLDGAGKRTLTDGLRTAFQGAGKSVASLAFPRYGQSVHADLAAEALHGRHGDLAESVYAMAMLFALDRAGARDELAGLLDSHDVVLLDRYVASNAAYSAARLHQDADGEVVSWVAELEFGRFGLPEPDHQLLLDVSVELAAERPGSAPPTTRPGPAMPTSATGDCSSAPAPSTHNWPPPAGPARGRYWAATWTPPRSPRASSPRSALRWLRETTSNCRSQRRTDVKSGAVRVWQPGNVAFW